MACLFSMLFCELDYTLSDNQVDLTRDEMHAGDKQDRALVYLQMCLEEQKRIFVTAT